MGYTNRKADFFARDGEFYLIFGDHTKSVNIAEGNFCVMDNVKVLKPKMYNKSITMYIIAVWKRVIPNLGYARHWATARDCKFQLPADEQGNPDYAYMEEYIKTIMEKSKKSITNLKSAISI